MVSTVCINYTLTHGLGEVPLFFMIGMGESPYGQSDTTSSKLLGAWGFSDRLVSFRLSQQESNSPIGAFREGSLKKPYKSSLGEVDENTITVAHIQGNAHLIPNIPYYWVALAEGSFS